MRHKEYIAQLTTREKADATVMEGGRCSVIERVGNKGFYIGDNPRGNDDYAVEKPENRKEGAYYPVCFPQAAAQAACWDESVSCAIGKAMGRECYKQDMNVLLRPGVNIKRSPLCGRNFEYYSEDPVLAGKQGAAFIRGVQSEGTAACLKHYCVNSQEFERMTTNAVVSRRALRELYLKPFEIAIREGDPWTIMTSYNKVNGKWVPASEELMGLLRREFGFRGAVISDAMAVQTEKVDSHRNGLDFEIGGRGVHPRELLDAINSGKLAESVLDENIDRLLTLEEKTGNKGAKKPECPQKDHDDARRFAAEGIVLLKNEGVLPLSAGAKVAVIGRLAKETNYMGCGSGHMNGWKVENTYEELVKIAGMELPYADAYPVADSPRQEQEADEGRIAEAVRVAKEADIVLFFAGLPVGYESEGFDRTNLALPENMRRAFEAVAATGKKLILVHAAGSAVDLKDYAKKCDGVLHSYPAGEGMGGAIADVLYGAAEPGGRLPETFPLRLQDTPAYGNFPHYPTEMPDVFYGEDIYVGYRWYEKREIPVLYPFGYGLSYTEFSYSDIRLDEQDGAAADENEKNAHPISVSVTIKNNGSRKGSQVLQVYVGKPDSRIEGPVKELKAYRKVMLEAGEEQTVTIPVNPADFGYYDEVHDCWVRESGNYDILVGISSRDILAKLSYQMAGRKKAHRFKQMDALEWFLKEPALPEILKNKSEMAKATLQMADMGDLGADLIGAIPAYRMAEGSAFRPAGEFTREELQTIIDELNEYYRM